MSIKTSDNERKYTSFELEVLAVVEALKKFRIYVLGTSFKIITDCDALVKTLSKKELNPRIARWTLYLQEFNYTIEHRTGSKMAHADALNRSPRYYCNKQNILHISITTGLPRSNGQIEKQNSPVIAALSKLSVDDPDQWYSHVPYLQEILNSIFQRSIKMTPFELLFGTKMKSCQDIEIVQLLNDEITAQFQEYSPSRCQKANLQSSR
ncbi:transposon Ty3-I Gag-Pol polyprotein [Trichonephila clavipes]|nr:transposon Ty3-I Gag-Pol polyprotein [Trichonephila clavipes]